MDAFDKQQKAYDEGARAYRSGKPRTDNPKSDEGEREAWVAGYDRAKELDDAEPNNWLRGYYCAVAQALREEGGTTTLIESLFRNGGDWREADPEDIALFKQHGLTKDN